MDREWKSRQGHRLWKSAPRLDRETSLPLAGAANEGGSHRKSSLL